MTDATMHYGRDTPGDPSAHAGMAAFAALVLADETLQARLGAIEQPDAYIADAVAIAAAHGIALGMETLRATIRPDPLGLSRWMPSPVTLDRWPSRGWLPARAVQTDAKPVFDWAWFGPGQLDAPFYEDSVRRFAPRPFSLMFRTRTSLDALIAGNDGSYAPAGFIHHLSRCGSTLAAQMLGADPHHVVLSEPEPLDAVVRWAMESGAPLDEQVAALRAIVAALGRDRSGRTQRVFFKLDSWHVLALPLFRAAFPETPWVFLYRNPVEVLVSQRRQRGIHTVPGLLPVGIVDIPGAEGMAADRYAALVLKRMGEAVLEHWPSGGGLLVDYTEMPEAIIDRIAPHFGFVPDLAQRAAMIQVATRDAKAPDQIFVPDTAAKRRDVPPEIETARALVDPVHARLEALRKTQ
jgi:hypothetical protein